MKWRYFGRTAGVGPIFQIYRCPDNGRPLWDQAPEDVQVMRKDGTWESGKRDVLLEEELTGWFDEVNDELSEQEALALVDSWSKGKWPSKL